tara:strand:+ start:109 stop:372 length:264 start_codon:yes stop_codon:yes gene_type:complete
VALVALGSRLKLIFLSQKTTKMKKKNLIKKQKVHVIQNEPDDLTEEVAKTLAEIKDQFDLPTEEVEATIEKSRFKKILKNILTDYRS